MASVLSSVYTYCSTLGVAMFCVSPAVSLPLIITPIRVLVNKGISCFFGGVGPLMLPRGYIYQFSLYRVYP